MSIYFDGSDLIQIKSAIANAVHNAFSNLKDSEPQLVANLVWQLPKQINEIKLSGNIKISAGGVFVHSRPLVTCTSFPTKTPSSVEIGDVLLIRTLVVDGGVKQKQALLLQAKKAKSIPAKPDNVNQWHLYEKWPRFTYAARSGDLAGKKRYIQEPDMYDAAKYLLIASTLSYAYCTGCFRCSPCDCFCWHMGYAHFTAKPTKPDIGAYRCFVCELVDFLNGNVGKVFEKPASRTRGWNQVIHDLINDTAKAKTIFMGRANQKSSKYQRGNGRMFLTQTNESDFFMVSGSSKGSGENNKPPEDLEQWEESDHGGISIIEVVIEQEE